MRSAHTLSFLLVAGIAACAVPQVEDRDSVEPTDVRHPDEGKLVRSIEVRGCEVPEVVLRLLKTRVGGPFNSSVIAADIE